MAIKNLRGAKPIRKRRDYKEDPLESKIEEKIWRYARDLGCWQSKFTSQGNPSVPDRIFTAPPKRKKGGRLKQGKLFMIEVKSKGNKPTAKQADKHEELREFGIPVFWCDNADEGKRIVEEFVVFNDVEGYDYLGRRDDGR